MRRADPRFRLQFRPDLISRLAEEYGDDDTGPLDAQRAIQRYGCVQKGQLLVLARWKSPRIIPRIMSNSAGLVEEATRAAFTAVDERLRIGALMILAGVSFPVASVILHFGHRDPYPVLDFRAIQSLGVEQPKTYTFDFWWAYVQGCRKLAAKHDVSMRTLDRALWQWSNQHGRAG